MSYIRPESFSLIPPVVKNLLIINGLFFLGTLGLATAYQIDLVSLLGLHPLQSEFFQPFQYVSHMFMHGGFAHILFNMFALWMFGAQLENYWGGRRFLVYYLITGVGAAMFQTAVNQYQIAQLASGLSPEMLEAVREEGWNLLMGGQNYVNAQLAEYNRLIHTPMVGASGAVFGLLLAFGMCFPDAVIYLYFALPIKAKYFVVLYGLFELFAGIRNSSASNIAHFAHLGGMVFGFFLILWWRKRPVRF